MIQLCDVIPVMDAEKHIIMEAHTLPCLALDTRFLAGMTDLNINLTKSN